jgi:hypothetical protein
MPKRRKGRQPTIGNKAMNAEAKQMSNNAIKNQILRRLINARPNNVVLQSKLSKLSKGLRTMMAPRLINSYKKRRNGMKKPGDNYQHIGSIKTTYMWPDFGTMYPTTTRVNLRKAKLKNSFLLKEDARYKYQAPPLNSRTPWPFEVVESNGTRARNVNTRLYESRGNHVGAMNFGTTAHNVPQCPNRPHLRREGLVTQISKHMKTPVFGISTFSKPKFPLGTRFPGLDPKQRKVGNYVTTNLYTRNNFSRGPNV